MARAQQNNRRDDDNRNALVAQPARLPMPAEAAPLGVDEGRWKALVNAVFPSAKTVDGVLMALQYCKERNLDVMKRPVHVVPMWNSALGREVETVWPGINEYRTTASRTGLWAGSDECEFGPVLHEGFKVDEQREKRNGDKYRIQEECPAFDFPEWARVTVYKQMNGQRVQFVGPKVYFKEIFSGVRGVRVPNDKWRQSPRQMLEKCAEAAALRRAFPEELGNVYTAEEMAGKVLIADTIEGSYTEATPDPIAKPTRESVKTEWEQKGIPKDRWDDIEVIQGNLDNPASSLAGIEGAQKHFMELYRKEEWPEEALDELQLRFDTAIAKMKDDGTTDGNQEGEGNEQTTD